MVQKTSPFIESKYGWNLGESGWNTGADENFLKFAFMLDNGVDGVVTSLPQTPVNGTSYYLTTDNRFYFVADGTYYSSPCPKWFTFKIKNSGQKRIYDGSSIVSLPSDIDVSSIISQGIASTNKLISDLANATGSSYVGFTQDASSSVKRTVLSKLRDRYSVRDFSSIQAGIDYLSSIGGGELYLPAGNYYESFVIKDKVKVVGDLYKTVIYPSTPSDLDVIVSRDFYNLTGTNNYSNNTPNGFGLKNLIISGTSSTNFTGNLKGLSIYGYNYDIENVFIKDVPGRGCHLEWGQYGEPPFGMETTVRNLRVDNVGEEGLWFAGPHDSDFDHVIIVDAGQKSDNTYDGFHQEGFGNGRFRNLHVWHRSTSVNRVRWSVYANGSSEFVSCHAEGGRKQLYFGGYCVWVAGNIYAPRSTDSQIVLDGEMNILDSRYSSDDPLVDAQMLELGRAKQSARNRVKLNANFSATSSTKSPVLFTNDAGNEVDIRMGGWTGSSIISGTAHYSSDINIRQAFPNKAFLRRGAQTNYATRFDGYGNQTARSASIPGTAEISYNVQLSPSLTVTSFDASSVGFSAVVPRQDGIYGLSGPAGSSSINTGFFVDNSGLFYAGGNSTTAKLRANTTGVGFYGNNPIAKQSVSGSRGSNAALQSLLTALSNLGIITDSTSA